ncbi:unnamed protein product [Cylicocyclus nassatus]|uniref:Uncharacterized protein n=1 Tax=Cylicocyclus nassatus TaxID=53992 RepID=A0AA36GSC0_CYLNA|nr:unnamed protein product [Cylicocyclus nassatus]
MVLFLFAALFAAVKIGSAVDPIQVIVVSNQSFDPSMNNNHMQVFKMLLHNYIKSKNFSYKQEDVSQKIINEGGQFSILYKLKNFDCDGLIDFAREGKRLANFVKTIKVKCSGRNEVTI